MQEEPTEMRAGSVVFAPTVQFNAVKVFSATMATQREQLGEVVTAWIERHPAVRITEIVVTQSSDAEFHCIAITVLYRELVRSRSK